VDFESSLKHGFRYVKVSPIKAFRPSAMFTKIIFATTALMWVREENSPAWRSGM
jgi:hypothetical protein